MRQDKQDLLERRGSTGTLYLVTNDVESSADRIYEVYQKRWHIEEYHKSIKQNASLEKSPAKVVRSQKNHIFASFYSQIQITRKGKSNGISRIAKII